MTSAPARCRRAGRWARFGRSTSNLSAVAALGALLALAAAADLLAPDLAEPKAAAAPFAGPNTPSLGQRLQAPSAAHPFGTDGLGRDVLARLIHGARVTLAVALGAAALSTLLGVLVGLIAAGSGSWIDALLSRATAALLSIPPLFLVLAVMGLCGEAGPAQLALVLGCTGWAGVARMVRAEVLRVRTLDFVLAAKALGFSRTRILARHVLPNALASTWASLPFAVASAAFSESALSFLGFGVAPPTPSWGELLMQAYEYAVYPGAWWLALFPGLGLFALLAACARLGEGLQEAVGGLR